MASGPLSTRGLFVVGTDTDVGKTFLTARIARQLIETGIDVGVFKPACSGAEQTDPPTWRDVETLWAAVDHRFPRERICPQMFRAPLAPPVAAQLENKHIDEELLASGVDWWRGRVEILLVEGVGGLLCPLSRDSTVCDLASKLGFPLLVVAHLGLGTINHTLLTLEVARQRGLEVMGIVLNETAPGAGGQAGESNAEEIASRGRVPVLAVVRHQDSAALRPLVETRRIDWQGLITRSP